MKIEVDSLVRYRDFVAISLISPLRVIEIDGHLVKLETGIWWPVAALISEQEYHDWQQTRDRA